MTREWKWKSKSGKAFFNAGYGRMDAVGAEKPSEAIPLQEGTRLLFSKGIDRIWLVALAAGVLRLLTHKNRNKGRKIRRNAAGIRRLF